MASIPSPFQAVALLATLALPSPAPAQTADLIGRELSSYERLENGREFELPLDELLRRGELAFTAQWTQQQGAGRPLTNGSGRPLADPGSPLQYPRNFNRVSAMDANSCGGCHGVPRLGGGGEFSAGAFVAAHRFDAATFDPLDSWPLRGAMDETGQPVQLSTIGNYRASLGLFGSGYIEMLARQMTADLQAIRDSLAPGAAAELATKGVRFGVLARTADGGFDVSAVEGLPEQSLAGETPSLIVRPFQQSGSVVSVREFVNGAFNQHFGMQTQERFGAGADPDGDGFRDELTVADVTAVTLFLATMDAPGRVVPNDPAVERAIFRGERLFDQIGCTSCHIAALPLEREGWIFTEPNPYNPPDTLQAGEAETLAVDLTSDALPGHRLQPHAGVVWVPAFTDLKLHDITRGPEDPAREALNINLPPGSEGFLAGNSRFLTKKLWGAANERPYFHHGKLNTLREATLHHFGEAEWTRDNFLALSATEQDQVIEFLKSLQVLPEGATSAVVDENGAPKPGRPSEDASSGPIRRRTRR